MIKDFIELVKDTIRTKRNGPYSNVFGHVVYYKNNVMHRLDGPAYKDDDGHKEWWYEGKLLTMVSQKEFEKLIKLKAFW